MLRDVLLKVTDRTIEPAETRVGRVYVRTLTAGEKDDFDAEVAKDGRIRSRLVMLTCCDEKGNLEFGENDLAAIDAMPLDVLEPIFDAALQINKLDENSRKDTRKKSRRRGVNSSSV